MKIIINKIMKTVLIIVTITTIIQIIIKINNVIKDFI